MNNSNMNGFDNGFNNNRSTGNNSSNMYNHSNNNFNNQSGGKFGFLNSNNNQSSNVNNDSEFSSIKPNRPSFSSNGSGNSSGTFFNSGPSKPDHGLRPPGKFGGGNNLPNNTGNGNTNGKFGFSYNDQPSNGNFNNGFGGTNSNNGSYQPSTLVIVMVVIIVIGLVVVLLDVTQVFRKDEPTKTPETTQKEEKPIEKPSEEIQNEYEIELRRVSKLADMSGNYNIEAYENKEHEIETMYPGIDKNTLEGAKQYYAELEDIASCQDGYCMMIEVDSKGDIIIHAYDMETDEYNSANLTGNWEENQAKLYLSTACANVDNNGDLDLNKDPNEDGYMKCESFMCKVVFGGKEYFKDCREA